jgi:hypothetical protein
LKDWFDDEVFDAWSQDIAIFPRRILSSLPACEIWRGFCVSFIFGALHNRFWNILNLANFDFCQTASAFESLSKRIYMKGVFKKPDQ